MTAEKFKWDAKLYQDNSSFQYELAMMAINRLKPRKSEKILDIGCGNAMVTIELAKHVPEGEIIAIEISADMYGKALENIKKSGAGNISIINRNAFDIDYKDEFDAVFSNSAIHWIYDLESMYGKIYKALKKGGRIMIQTGSNERNSLIDALDRFLLLPVFKKYLKDFKYPWRFLSIADTIKMLEDNNFKKINVDPYNYKMGFSNLKSLIGFFKSAALIPLLTELPEEAHGQMISEFLNLYFDINKSQQMTVEMHRLFTGAEK
jgi:trans-aconitate 2-methyltransferase